MLANSGRILGWRFPLDELHTPEGWIDSRPVLPHQPVSFLMSLVVRYNVPVPSHAHCASCFADRWVVAMFSLFSVKLDLGKYIHLLWRINIPTGLRETLWREVNGSQPLDTPSWSGQNTLKKCACGSKLSLNHILTSCSSYNLKPLLDILLLCLKVQ